MSNISLATPKYAVLGGTFDPFHNDHLNIIIGLYKSLSLDFIVVVPSHNPPHKNKDISSFDNRCQIIELSTAQYPWIIIDPIEKELGFKKSFTYLVLENIVAKYGPNLFYIMGGDSFLNYLSWKEPKRIAQISPIIVVPRNNNFGLKLLKEKVERLFEADIEIIELELLGISSSQLRAYIEVGFSQRIVNYLNRDALDFILKKELYSKFSPIISKLKAAISSNLLRHSIETALYSVELANIHGLDTDEAFLSGLLHDYSKEDIIDTLNYNDYPPQVIHQFTGAQKATKDFDINENICQAIKFHTTGAPNMTQLGMVVYCADKLEKTRDYDGANLLRVEVESNLIEGFKGVLKCQYNYLINNNKTVCKLTEQAMLCYNI